MIFYWCLLHHQLYIRFLYNEPLNPTERERQRKRERDSEILKKNTKTNVQFLIKI